jgi:hypothetical protein
LVQVVEVNSGEDFRWSGGKTSGAPEDAAGSVDRFHHEPHTKDLR